MTFPQEKELERQYLLLQTVETTDYTVRMALGARLPFLLPLSVKTRDGEEVLRADITACTSLTARLSSATLTGRQLRTILSVLRDALAALPRHLLYFEDLCLDPAFVYCGPQADEVRLLYIPGHAQEDPCSVRLLAQFFLQKIDHADAQAVDLAYTLYDQVSRDTFHLPDILRSLLLPTEEPAQDAGPLSRDAQQERSQRPDAAGNSFAGAPLQSKALRSNTGDSMQRFHGRSRASSRAHNSARGHIGTKRHAAPGRKHTALYRTLLLPGAILLVCMVALILLFHMDTTQMGGMGFLWTALTWMVHSALARRRSDSDSLWADEDEAEAAAEEEAFYRAFLEEEPASAARSGAVYAQETSGSAAHPRTPGSEGVQVESLVSLHPAQYPDIPLTGSLVLGKDARKADIVLAHSTISRAHARVEPRADGYYVTDLFSTNGTFLDGQRLEAGQAAPLRDGAVLTLADLAWRATLTGAQRTS